MSREGINKVWRRIRQLVRAPAEREVGDGLLLERYVTQQDEGAFQTLVERHGPLVLGTCRRLLRDVHAAEDAFQAVFLVLAQRAASLERRPSLAGWLHGVAFRIALRARGRAARRQTKQQPMSEPETVGCADQLHDADRRELGQLIDAELGRLPARYREPLVLCYLQGKTNEQAAQELGQPVGSMSRHLARGREMLRDRLAQRGVTSSAVLLGPALGEATAAVPRALACQVVRSALQIAAGQSATEVASAEVVSLATGLGGATQMTRFKIVLACILAIGVASAAASAFVYRANPPVLPAVARNEPPHPTLQFTHDKPIARIVLAPNGQMLATDTGEEIYLWDTATGKEKCRFPHGRYLFANSLCPTFSPDGRLLAWGGCAQIDEKIDCIHLGDVASGKELPTLKAPNASEGYVSLAFSPDSKLLATGTWGIHTGSTVIWETSSGRDVRRLAVSAQHLAFSPEGKLLAASWSRNSEAARPIGIKPQNDLFLWDLVAGKEIRAWWGNHQDLEESPSLASSPNGKLLASATSDKIRFWEVDTGKEVCSWPGLGTPHPKPRFSPDGSLLAVGSFGNVRIWEALSDDNNLAVSAAERKLADVEERLAQTPEKRVALSEEYDKHRQGLLEASSRMATKLDAEFKKNELRSARRTVQFARLANGRVLAATYRDKVAVVEDATDLVRSARPAQVALVADELPGLWNDLASSNVPQAYRSLGRLVGDPENAVPFIRARWNAHPKLDLHRTTQLISDLASEQFVVRQTAETELEKMGEAARVALERALASKPPLEVQRRIERLLEKTRDSGSDQLRWMRVIQGLEHMDTAKARDLLKVIAEEERLGSRSDADAKAALERLAK